MPDTPAKFYLTTPIYYVNARPHIGHAYSTIAADVIARRHRLLGDDTFFLTGTDEHGQKVQRSAEKAGIPPQQFADQVSATFRGLWLRMGITNDDYIRTTDERHKRGVQKLWRTLEERGAIYLSSYTGQYCVSEEMFIDGPPGTIGPDGKPTETVTEENYFFRLSDYQQPLIDLIESDQLHIQPEAIRNEVLSFLYGNSSEVLEPSDKPITAENLGLMPDTPNLIKEALDDGRLGRSNTGKLYVPGALKDLSISRTSFTWGIPVPPPDTVILSEAKNPRISLEAPPASSQDHVIYVWLDALANYITAIGYGSDDPADIAKFAKYWPADLHLVGKEITRFHCVYWPAFLLAAGLPLPKSVVANGWLLFEESKMSKSRGNVVRTETILDAFGPLCPPVPTPGGTDSSAPQPAQNATHPVAVILSAAKDPDAPDAATAAHAFPPQNHAATRSSSGLQPAEKTPTEKGALAPGLTPPTKAQQDLFASDVIRYFLLREIPFGQDGSFSFDALITRYNADLANGYGNLVSRTLSMISQYFGGILTSTWMPKEIFPIGDHLLNNPRVNLSINDLTGTVKEIVSYIATLDAKLTEVAPWKLAKKGDAESRKDLESILYQTAESIRIITALLFPFMPYATASVWAQLGLGSIQQAAENGELKNLTWGGLKPGTRLGPLAPIFPRAEKGLAQIMNDMENPSPTPESEIPTPEALNAVHPPAAAAEPAAPAIPEIPTIAIDDFVKVDLRVAEIVVAERIPKADKLLRLEVDLGPMGRRQILSGIAEFYTPEELVGRRIAVIANLAPRKMRGLESHGMLLAASEEDHASKPILASFSHDVPNGSRIR